MNYARNIRLKLVAATLTAFAAVFAIVSPVSAAAVANHLVISEIQLGTRSSASNQFIELYNPTASAVSLEGWSLQYRPSNRISPTEVLVTFGAGKGVPSYGFFLVGKAGEYAGATAADDSFASSLDLRDGTVLLSRTNGLVTAQDDGNIVDLVGYGNSAEWAETASASAPSLDESIERLPDHGYADGNGTDTNNNAADFVTQNTPNPQGTTSAKEVPAGPVFTNLSPAADSYIATTTPSIEATITDAGSGVDAGTVSLLLNGTAVARDAFSFDTANGKLIYQSGELRQGTHTVLLVATDNAGYSSTQSWNFTIDTIAPTLSMQITKFSPVTTNVSATVVLSANDAPAGEASGVSEMQIAFDGVIDTEAWEPFSAEVTRNLMNKEGLQAVVGRVRDRAGNVSALASATTTLTFAPTPTGTSATPAPTSATSSTVGNTITITWPVAPGAVSYIVRYSDGQVLYGPFTTKDAFIVISNLDPNKKYNFEVASVNAGGSISPFTKASPGPVPTAATQSAATPETAPSPFGGPDLATLEGQTGTTGDGVTVTASPTPTISPVPSPTPTGQVQGGEEDRQRDWTRVIVALSILIIAAGIATGGWYLYQWWLTRPNGGKGKGKGKGGRW